MSTEIKTDILANTPDGHARAAEIFRAGGLVAFPTETVYGLGADATNDTAVAGIYAAKGRPSFNPLIVHVASVEAAKTLVKWNDYAEKVASAFWPGPLTMVLPLKDGAPISKLVTAGLSTLAVRVPANTVAHQLLETFGGPVAAPSANRSGQISPTRANHVIDDLSGRIHGILDGGACENGLESTIVGLADVPTMLRPGHITREELSKTLGLPVALRHEGDSISAPGQTLSHYAPKAKVRLNAIDLQDGEVCLGFGDMDCDLNLSTTEDLLEAAANLFEFLHQLDDKGADTIAVAPIPHVGLGIAINDRLTRAAAPRS